MKLLFRGYTGITERKMGTTIEGLGFMAIRNLLREHRKRLYPRTLNPRNCIVLSKHWGVLDLGRT